ncbi:hypothetical protein NEIRO03_1165 [Nematocida sp. AWRm78]|nr:hypothetical protein NEIRO02_1235 [Nematocida sp. AWRm79]KAI5183583.1 hypothetical protein NEIRO03_1165 [Nematocida sp. AWRm78]
MDVRAILSPDKRLRTELQRRKIALLVGTQCFILFMLIFFLFRRKNNFMGVPQHTLILDTMYDLCDQINDEVDRCLKKPTRKEQNNEFSKIDIPELIPIRLSEMTAAFELNGDISHYLSVLNENINTSISIKNRIIIKRVILKVENIPEEEEISMMVDHPNVVHTYFTYKCNYTNYKGVDQKLLWLFIEPLDIKVSIKEHGKKENEIRSIMRDVLLGLQYLHSKNIAHLDLKLSNVMGYHHNNELIVYKIIDFGFSRVLPQGKIEQTYPKRCYGTFPYKPPEVWISSIHGLASDVWCIGAMSLFLANKKSSYFQKKGTADTAGNTKDYAEFRRFLEGKVKIPIDSESSPELVSFIQCCMRRAPADRPTVAKLLKHPFICDTKLSPHEAQNIRYSI